MRFAKLIVTVLVIALSFPSIKVVSAVRSGDQSAAGILPVGGGVLDAANPYAFELYQYDALNRLVKSDTMAGTAEYAYNAAGLRVSKTINGVATKYVWDGGQIVLEKNGSGAVTARYTRGIGLIKSDTSWYLFNAHGDVVQLADSSGSVTKNYNYDAFGIEGSPDSTDINPFRYAGEYYDRETGTYYLRARYYSPVLGRFITEDSVRSVSREMPNGQEIDDPLSLNLYTYSGNNPVAFIDPSGHSWKHWGLSFLIFGVAALSVVITAGGTLPLAVTAVGSVASGMAAGTTGATMAAGAFIGAGAVLYGAVWSADYSSAESFADSANWGTVGFTAGGAALGAGMGYLMSPKQRLQETVREAEALEGVGNPVPVEGLGSTGRTAPSDLNEQMAMHQVRSNPLQGATKVPLDMSDVRWPKSDGWVKMQSIVKNVDGTKTTIHFLYNEVTGVFDDFKFK